MKRGEIFLGTVTEKHTILDLCTGRPRQALGGTRRTFEIHERLIQK